MSEALLLLVMLGATGVMALARQTRIHPGIAIVIVAGAISFIPAMPRFQIEPALIFGLVMPPLLYSAALHFSFSSFKRHFRTIVVFGVGLVVVTTVVIGYLTSYLVPSLGLASALLLAGIVSPPDTITTVTHGREIGLPRRVIAILTGESLINDAAALTIFTVTVAAVDGRGTFIANPLLFFFYGAFAGTLVGVLLGSMVTWVRARLGNPTLETTLSLLVPFTAFLVAEQLHASGVIAVVVAGFLVSVDSVYGIRQFGSPTAYVTRIQERALWPVVDTLLEAFVFAYIGLQLRFIIDDLRDSGEHIWTTVGVGFAVLAAAVVLRFVIVFWLYRQMSNRRDRWLRRLSEEIELPGWRGRRRERHLERGRQMVERAEILDWKEKVLISWTGMRGIVTLAAAAGIPLTTATGAAFPGRSTIQFVAFTVAIGTLVIQGATLPFLADRLHIATAQDDEEAERALNDAEKLVASVENGEKTSTSPAEHFQRQRSALKASVIAGKLDDEFAQIVMQRIDLRQAAAETSEPEN
jgi:CPA1 family monovalent cation:H+ antiporter